MSIQVILWDVATAAPLRRWREHAGKINGVCFNELSTVVLSASSDGTGAAWDARSKNRDPMIIFGKFGDVATSVASDDAEVLFGSLDGKVGTCETPRLS
jgi:mitogen-activated protein kinase organizer 1